MTEKTTEGDPSHTNSMGRREVVTALSTTIAGFLAGCNDGRRRPDTNLDNEDSGTTNDQGGVSELVSIREDIEQVYEQVEELPIVENGTFVFDMEESRDTFDYEDMMRLATEALQAADEINDEKITAKKKELLIRTARIGFLRIDQRHLIHRVIVGGLMFRSAFHDEEYERGTDVMIETTGHLEKLNANRQRLREQTEAYERPDLDIPEGSNSTIRSELDVLVEVLHWSIPAFEGFKSSSRGMVAVAEGNLALGNDRYGPAREQYRIASEHFGRARTAFDTAHGRGQSIEQAEPIANELRCFIPALQEGYDDLDDAFSEFEAGNEDEGQRIARQELGEMDREFRRCM